MAKPILDDALWELLAPLLPPPKPRPFGHPGRKRLDNRRVLTGILFVLKTGIPWEYLPQEMAPDHSPGSGMSCWRRLHEWQAAGVWQRIHRALLARLRAADKIDFSRAIVDSASVRAVLGGAKVGPNPTDRGKNGSKHHLLTDANGIPLAATLTGAHRNDITQLIPLVDTIPAISGQVGHPRRRPERVYGDRGYDSQPHRRRWRARGIQPRLARRGTAHGSGLGVYRWVVERTLSWLHQYRRLRVRWERRADIHESFLTLGCILICHKCLEESFS